MPRQRRYELRKVFASRDCVQACSQAFSRLPPPLAHRELHERRGETVRKRPQILPILQTDYFFAQGMCLYMLMSSFSAGLRLAKTTEIWAKEGLCLSRLRSGLFSDLSRLPPPLAHRELHEWRGETVRKRPQILPIPQSVYFLDKSMCLYIFVGSFSAGLRLAKTTEIWAKWCICSARLLAHRCAMRCALLFVSLALRDFLAAF